LKLHFIISTLTYVQFVPTTQINFSAIKYFDKMYKNPLKLWVNLPYDEPRRLTNLFPKVDYLSVLDPNISKATRSFGQN